MVDPLLPRFDDPHRDVIDPFANACGSRTIRPDRVPLDLFFVIDTSGSMLDATASGVTKWAALRAAFAAFARAPESTGVSAGLGFFPMVQPGVPEECTNDAQCVGFGPCTILRTCVGSPDLSVCDSDAACGGAAGTCVVLGQCKHQPYYCAPLGERCSDQTGDVCVALPGRCVGHDLCTQESYAAGISDLVALPSGANALTTLLDKQKPDGMTPTGPALAGAIAKARASAMARPGRRVAIVLATDGFPTNCSPRSVADIEALAMQATAASPVVPIFVLGVFAPQEAGAATINLSRWAQAGGTPSPFIVSTTGNTSNALLSALTDIRATALACEYKIPEAQRGQLDLEQVNVRFLAGNRSFSTIGYVPTAADCDPNKGGWHYDVAPGAGMPTMINVCPSTCDKLRADPRGRVDLVVGCQTVRVD